jgi:uncharacterized membrane protein
MMQEIQFPLTLLAALGSGLMAGTFFAFSVFVMGALGRLPAEQGIAAMNSISVVVLNPIFLGVFLGTALVSGILGVTSIVNWPTASTAWLLAGSLLYLFGCFGVTMAFNVPLNTALSAVTPGTPEAAAFWVTYQSTWTAWNHVRTVAPMASLMCFIMALKAVP